MLKPITRSKQKKIRRSSPTPIVKDETTELNEVQVSNDVGEPADITKDIKNTQPQQNPEHGQQQQFLAPQMVHLGTIIPLSSVVFPKNIKELIEKPQKTKGKMQCEFCKKVFKSKIGWKKHDQNICLCLADHEHKFMFPEFDSLNDVMSYLYEEELDSIFVIASTKIPKGADTVLKYLTCRINGSRQKKKQCPAQLKIVHREEKYYLIGCVAHSHSMEPENLSLSRHTRELIAGLVSLGLPVKTIKENISSLSATKSCSIRKPVTTADIKNVRRAVESGSILRKNEMTDTVEVELLDSLDETSGDLGEVTDTIDASAIEEQEELNELRWKASLWMSKVLTWFNDVQAHKNEINAFHNIAATLNTSRKEPTQSVREPSHNTSKKRKLKHNHVQDYDKMDYADQLDQPDGLKSFLSHAITKPVTSRSWQVLMSTDDNRLISISSSLNKSAQTQFVKKFLIARKHYSCQYCKTFDLRRIDCGFSMCHVCATQVHTTCLADEKMCLGCIPDE